MKKFTSKIEIIGINPFVFLPKDVLNTIFEQAGKDKGNIPVKIKVDGHEFPQTLVKYSGHWRLYLNMPMRKAAKKEVGDVATIEIAYDHQKRHIPIPPKFVKALEENQQAKKVFDNLSPSLQLEIVKYLSFLKTEKSRNKNVTRAIGFLLGKARFIGRDKP